MTAGKVFADFKRKTRTWQQSDCRRQVLQILDRQKPDDGWHVTEAVCMGSGSFSRDNIEHCKRSMTQFVAFMDVMRHIQASSDSEVKVYAQEPVYTTVDLAFLKLLEVTPCQTPPGIMPPAEELVREGPRAMDIFSRSSFVCELFMERNPVFIERLLEVEVPLVVGSMAINRDKIRANGAKLDGDKLARLEEKFKNEYQSYRMPRFDEDPNVIEGLYISTRMPEDESEENSD